MRQLSDHSRLVIAIVKGNFSYESYKLAEKYIAKEVYGVYEMNKHVLVRFLREVLLDARDYSLERWEQFHGDAVAEAFKWTKEFSWDEYIRFHFAEICGLRVRTNDGTTLFNMNITNAERTMIESLAKEGMTVQSRPNVSRKHDPYLSNLENDLDHRHNSFNRSPHPDGSHITASAAPSTE